MHRILLALAALALLLAPTASAHKTTYSPDGQVKIVWGFLGEPAVTWTKTGIDLILTDNATGAPIAGAETTVHASLRYADQEIALDELRPQSGRAGAYSQPITLTRPGLYALVLKGTINASAVDLAIPAAHETEAIEEIFFPPVAESPFAADEDDAEDARIEQLEARIAALEAEAKTQAQSPATVSEQAPVPGASVALVALLAVAAALVVRRRAQP